MEIDPVLQRMEEIKQNSKAEKGRGHSNGATVLLRHPIYFWLASKGLVCLDTSPIFGFYSFVYC